MYRHAEASLEMQVAISTFGLNLSPLWPLTKRGPESGAFVDNAIMDLSGR